MNAPRHSDCASSQPHGCRSLRPTSALIGLLLLPVAAFGQTPPAATADKPAEDLYVLPQFVITEKPANPYQSQQALSATRVAMSIQDIPQTISVVSSDFLADSMSFKMSDAAKYVTPVVESTLPFGGDRYMIRGFQVSQEFIDGSVLSGGSGYSMSIPQFNIERIEVLKGPNAILVPGGSPGGVMNPITKSPMAKNAASVSLDLAQYNGNDVSFDVNRLVNAENQMAFRLVASYWKNDLYIKNQYRNGYEVAPSFSVQLSPTQKLIIKGAFLQNRETNLGGLTIDPTVASNQTAVLARGLPRNWSFGDVADTRHRSTERLSVELLSTLGEHVTSRLYVMGDHVHRIDEGGTNSGLTAAGGGSRNPSTGLYEPGVAWTVTNNADGTVTPVSTAAPVTDPSTWIWTHNVTRVNLNYYEGHIKNDYAAKFEGSWFKSTTLAGFAVDFSKVRFISTASASRPSVPNNNLNSITYPAYVWPAVVGANLGLATPWTSALNPTTQQRGGDIRSKQTTLNLFIMETLNLFSDRLQLSAGFSLFNGQLSRSDNKDTSLNWPILKSAPSYSLTTDAKSLGIVVKPIKEVSIFAGRNTTGGTMPGELSPGTYLEKTTTFGPDALYATATTVQKFRPTSGSQDEIGVKTSLLEGRFTAAFSYFKISQQNYPVPNSEWYQLTAQGRDAEAALLPNPIYLDLSSKGWEIEGTYSLGKNLTILGNYTQFKERQPITNVRVRAVPDKAYALYVDYRFTEGALNNFGVTVGMDYKGDVAGENSTGYTTSRPITGGVGFVPNHPSFLVGARTVVNLGFTYRAPTWTARLMIANVLDEDYILAAGSRGSAIVADPRNWKASMTYKF